MYASKTMLFCPKCSHIFNIVKNMDARVVCPYCDVLILTDDEEVDEGGSYGEDEYDEEYEEYEDYGDDYGIFYRIKNRLKHIISLLISIIKG